jgi:hypothetical protein
MVPTPKPRSIKGGSHKRARKYCHKEHYMFHARIQWINSQLKIFLLLTSLLLFSLIFSRIYWRNRSLIIRTYFCSFGWKIECVTAWAIGWCLCNCKYIYIHTQNNLKKKNRIVIYAMKNLVYFLKKGKKKERKQNVLVA